VILEVFPNFFHHVSVKFGFEKSAEFSKTLPRKNSVVASAGMAEWLVLE
jgi:hypothetical protein